MLVFKRTIDGLLSEEEMGHMNSLESGILDFEESFAHEYSFDDQEKGCIKNSVSIEFHWILSDERLNTTALQNDYPILVRF